MDGGYEADLFDDLDRQISRSVSPIASNIKITKTAIAGIVGDEIDSIELGNVYSLFSTVLLSFRKFKNKLNP